MADTKSCAASDVAGAAPRRAGPGSEIRSRWPLAFGKYELLRRMRLGGMAEVFRACEPPDRERALAIKRILPSFTDEADYVAMFIDEARLSMRFQHQGIVRAYELGQVDDEYYIALEYVDGQDVATLLARAREQSQPLPVVIACRIALDVCAALEYAHALRGDAGEALGIVHRDVSPQNLLVSYAGDVKLIDFGIAKSTEQLMRTQAGLLKGKYGYLSPEQARGQTLDRRSDLFSLGVCLYEMLSATRLFEGKNDFSTMRKVREGEILALHRRNASVPPALSAIVQRALARQRNDRFQTAGEMAVALEGFVRAGNLRCDREQLAQFMKDRFRDEAAAAASEQDAAGDPSTGLLEAFEGLEPRSSVSQMAVAPPMPEEVGNDLLESVDAEDEAEEADTNPPRALEPERSSDPDVAAAPIEDEPTRVVAYSSTVEGELAETRPRSRRDSSVRKHAARDDATRARRHPSAPSHAPGGAPEPVSQPQLPALQPTEEPLREQVAQESMDWDEDELSTHLYDPPEKRPVTAEYGIPPQVDMSALQNAAWQDAREMRAPRSLSGSPRARIPTLRPMPSDPVPSGVHMTTLRPGASSAARELAVTPQVASIRPAPVISAAPTPRIASIRPVSAPAAVIGPTPSHSADATDRYAPQSRGARTLTTKRIAAISWFPSDPVQRPRFIAMAIVAACVLIAIAAVLIGRTPEPSTIQVATEPVDAVVTLDGVQVAGSTSPFVFTHVTPDAPHVVAVGKTGYRAWSTTITLRSGRELKLPLVRLSRDERVVSAASAQTSAPQPAKPSRPASARAMAQTKAPRPSPPPARRPAPARVSRASTHPQPSRVATPSKPLAPVPAAVPQPSHIVTVGPVPRGDVGTGKLRINSRPWSQVYVDGRLIGTTPRTDVVLSAGVHTITLISPDFGYKRVLAVPIKRGETLTKIVDLAN